MNILVAVNSKYLVHMKTMLLSLAENNKCEINIFLMQNELSNKEISGLKRFIEKKCRGKLYVLYINKDELKNAPVGLHFSREMYFRIFCSKYVPENVTRILWLDSDIIVKGSIEDFYNSNFEDYSLIACGHREINENDPKVNMDNIKRLDLKEGGIYFNSGVILFNLEKIRREFDERIVYELIEEKKNILQYPDQDILNILFQNKVKYADKMIYNYQVHYDWKYKGEGEFIKKKAKIIHFAGPVKPWGIKYFHGSYKYYWIYYLKFNTPVMCVRSYLFMMCFPLLRNVRKLQ